jgi:hypothetical protein
MAEKTQVKAVEMVRCIRDEQARMLAGKAKTVRPRLLPNPERPWPPAA